MRWVEISQATVIEIKGNAKTPVHITAVVDIETPYVEFSYKDENLRLHYDFKPNDVVEVDFLKEKVFINGELQQNTIDLVKADFFHLDHGINEVSTTPAMQVDVKYKERWL